MTTFKRFIQIGEMTMKINRIIDHTLLKPEATREQIEKLCNEAKEYDFKSVCVNPYWVKFASELLSGSNTLVCTVIGFPLGANSTKIKAFETKTAIEEGAGEVDMVINIGELKAKNYDAVKSDIEEVVKAAGEIPVKVIIETCLLSDDEIKKVSEIILETGATFVKTSTGFSTGGAKVEDVALIKEVVGDSKLIKASGGIRDFETASKMIEAGANRLGVSAGIEIVKGAK